MNPAHTKTLLISEIFPPRTGGSGRWFWEIYGRMPREHFVIAAGEHPQQEAFDRCHDLALRRIALHLDRWGVRSLSALRGYANIYRRVGRIIRKHHVERLHCARLLPEGWVAWLLKLSRGIPYWCYVHGEETNYGVLSRELGWMMRRVLRGADLLIANSHNTAGILQHDWNVPQSKIRVMHPGVDTARFVPAPRDLAVRESLGWGNRPVVLTVGRLQERKGHDQMIRSLGEVRSQVPDVLYAIVGDGDQRRRLEALVDQESHREHVQFMGELDDAKLIQCYQQCDLFVLPNREIEGDIEGFGIVLLEAQACGKPVIAGASGGTAETMQIPATGRTVSCDQFEPLAGTVLELLGDPALREHMGQSARQWTVENFSWSSLARDARRLFGVHSTSPGDSNHDCAVPGKEADMHADQIRA